MGSKKEYASLMLAIGYPNALIITNFYSYLNSGQNCIDSFPIQETQYLTQNVSRQCLIPQIL